jgi:hypothetical protein
MPTTKQKEVVKQVLERVTVYLDNKINTREFAHDITDLAMRVMVDEPATKEVLEEVKRSARAMAASYFGERTNIPIINDGLVNAYRDWAGTPDDEPTPQFTYQSGYMQAAEGGHSRRLDAEDGWNTINEDNDLDPNPTIQAGTGNQGVEEIK